MNNLPSVMLRQFRALGLGAAAARPTLAARQHAITSVSIAPQRGMAEARGRRDDFEQEAPPPGWEWDDISPLAHAELERHREARHYARIAAYEMPRLAQLAKPFVPPTKATPLRFRYTTYMGEEHPAESKVVLEFSPRDLGLDRVQQSKLIKLVGARYDPGKKIVKMSCEMFEHQAQNKRYLSDLVDKLIAEAKDPKDTFEDIPQDFRHAKKARPMIARRQVRAFPLEWVEQAVQKEHERAAKTGRPVAEWVESAIEDLQVRKNKAAARAQVRLDKKEKFLAREEARQKKQAVAEKTA